MMFVYRCGCYDCEHEWTTISEMGPYECPECGSGEIVVQFQGKAFD